MSSIHVFFSASCKDCSRLYLQMLATELRCTPSLLFIHLVVDCLHSEKSNLPLMLCPASKGVLMFFKTLSCGCCLIWLWSWLSSGAYDAIQVFVICFLCNENSRIFVLFLHPLILRLIKVVQYEVPIVCSGHVRWFYRSRSQPKAFEMWPE